MNELIDWIYLALNYNPNIPIVSLCVDNNMIYIEMKNGEKYNLKISTTDMPI